MIRLIPQSEPVDLREVRTASGKKKEIHTEKWHRCVDKVKVKGRATNAYAICTSSLGDKSFLNK